MSNPMNDLGQKGQTRYVAVADGSDDSVEKNSGEGTINFVGNQDSQHKQTRQPQFNEST